MTTKLLENDGEATSLGWISNLDALLLGTVLTFLFAICAVYAYADSLSGAIRSDVFDGMSKENEELKKQLKAINTVLSETKKSVVAISQTMIDFRSRFSESEREIIFDLSKSTALTDFETGANEDVAERDPVKSYQYMPKWINDVDETARGTRDLSLRIQQQLKGKNELLSDIKTSVAAIVQTMTDFRSRFPDHEQAKIFDLSKSVAMTGFATVDSKGDTKSNQEKAFLKTPVWIDDVDKTAQEIRDAFVSMQEAIAKQTEEDISSVVRLEQSIDEFRIHLNVGRVKGILDFGAFETSRQPSERVLRVTQIADSMKNAFVVLQEAQKKLIEDLMKNVKPPEDDPKPIVPPSPTKDEFEIRRELLGISSKISFGKVAFVVDRSGSMEEKIKGKNKRGWDIAKTTIKSWYRNLGMSECMLVSYSDDVRLFPQNGTLSLSEGAKDKSLAALDGEIDSLVASGGTNTLEALRQAYSQNPTSIVLFTDGEPTKERESNTTTIVAAIKELAKSKKVPIIVIGIGDYGYPVCKSPNDPPKLADGTDDQERIFSSARKDWSPAMLQFLQDLADDTGGTFIGRDYYPAKMHKKW